MTTSAGECSSPPVAATATATNNRKRKSSQDGADSNSKQLNGIMDLILEGIAVPVVNDTIHKCGSAPLAIITTRPEDVLQKAHEMIHAFPYHQVPIHWRRLYEDAALYVVARSLKALAMVDEGGHMRKRVKSGSCENALRNMVKHLDSAIVVAGAPGRKALIDTTLQQLESVMEETVGMLPAQLLHISPPPPLLTQHLIHRSPQTLDMTAFQLHIDHSTTPTVIPNVFDHWPAMELWKDVAYLKRRTLYGSRVVPVEVGSSYADEDHGQRFITFGEFAEQYLIPGQSKQIGYLAQHNLFDQIPVLRNDITIPDYCWTVPPPPAGAAAETPGLESTEDLDEPMLSAWLGPSGTKSPLHTDPHHNTFCQVVGYKYVRLYPPEERAKLYPRDLNEQGIDMSNTSQVDIWHLRPGRDESKNQQEQLQKFPLLQKAQYEEAILGPGDCLYIPLGWWHYFESLTTSFSVSFWWN